MFNIDTLLDHESHPQLLRVKTQISRFSEPLFVWRMDVREINHVLRLHSCEVLL